MEQLNLLGERINVFLDSSPVGQRLARYPCFSFILCFSVLFHLVSLGVGPQAVLPALAASPSATLMNGRIWTLLTSALVETNTTKFGFFLAAALLGSFKLESEQGSVGLSRLLLVTTISASFLSALTFVAVYMLTLNDDIFFSHVFGLGGIVVSLAVAALKRMKSSSSSVPVAISQDIYFVLPLGLAGYGLLGLRFPLHDALLVVFSFFAAVAFLRNDDFRFRHFLPGSLSGRSIATASSLGPALPMTPLGAAPAVDPTRERFRARGFRLLDKKLAELEATPEVPLDLGEGVTTGTAEDKA